MDHIEGLIVGITILAILVAVAVYVILKLRAGMRANVPAESAQEMLTKFNDLRDRGVITPEEYKAIRRNFTAQIVGSTPSFDPAMDDEEAAERAAQLERLLRGEMDGR
ncbi:MAG: hypothetical protein HUK22_07465 [Thermoguttaceae bacterium]|nr:hypothetical protein [Thermoguttaceae bacterium]